MKSSNVGGVDVTYGWDGAGRLVSVGDPAGVSTFEYDAAGRMTKRVDPNGVEMTYAYDSANRVLDVMAKRGGTAFADYAYQRDVIGRVTNLTELSGRVVTYGYSTAGRLVNETISGEPHGINGAISYTHDAVGNRLTRTSTLGPVNGQAFVYDANDRIAAEMYDANGNTLASEGDVFQYDFEDRLTAINGGVAISYDAGGNIGARTEGGTKVSYLVDEVSPTGYTQVVEEVTAGTVGKTFTYGQMALRSGGKTYVQDGHTDVRALASSSGVVTDEYDYEAFGVGTRTSGSSSNPLRYTGERAESGGLTFLRARHMRNGTGRFRGMDPWMGSAELVGSLHRTNYASGEPVNGSDPSGWYTTGLWAAWIGTAVHKEICKDFMLGGPSRECDKTLGTIGKPIFPFGSLRPDLIDTATKELYEIKPVTRGIEGKAQLSLYLAVLNANGGSWVAGSSFNAHGGAVVVKGIFVAYFAFPTLGGVILYESLDTASVVISGLVVAGLSSNHGNLMLRVGTAFVLGVMGGF